MLLAPASAPSDRQGPTEPTTHVHSLGMDDLTPHHVRVTELANKIEVMLGTMAVDAKISSGWGDLLHSKVSNQNRRVGCALACQLI